MRKTLSILLLVLVGWSCVRPVLAQTSTADVNGQTIDVNQEKPETRRLLRALDLFTGGNFLRESLNKLFNFVSNACYYALLRVYGLIGTILIPIPDLTDPGSYLGDAAQVVKDVYSIMVYLGFFFAIVCFVAYVGPQASGLGQGGGLTVMAFMRLAVALALLFAWPHIFSMMSRAATELGYLIYGQNRITTTGVFEGIKNLDGADMGQKVRGAVAGSAFGSPATGVRAYARAVWSVVYTVSLFLCLIGLMVAGRKISTGDQQGFKILSGAVIGLVLVLLAGHFARYLVPALSSMDSPGMVSSASETLNTGGVPALPGIHPVPAAPTSSETVDDYADFLGAFLRTVISLYGLFVCVGVLLSKFFQVISLLVLFFLGPVLAGLVAHPRTEAIARSGFNMTLFFMLNSVVWSIALLGLYLITHIVYGVETLGAGNLLTALAILAGLKLIQSSDKFAGLFASGASGQIGGHQDWGSFWGTATGTAASMGRAYSETKKVFGENSGKGKAAQALGAKAGAVIGTMVPFMGPVAGAKVGAVAARAGGAFYNQISNTIAGPSQSMAKSAGAGYGVPRGNPYEAVGAKARTLAQGRPGTAAKPAGRA